MNITLAAGVSQNVSIAGSRFYFMEGDGRINVKLKGSGDSRDFNLYPRQGVNSDVRFAGVEITNITDAEQTIEIEISDREVFDNRIPTVTEIVPVGGALPVYQTEPVEIKVPHLTVNTSFASPFVGPFNVLIFDDKRPRASLYFEKISGPVFEGERVYVGSNSSVGPNNGYPVNLGEDYVHENYSALWVLMPDEGEYRIHVIEDRTGLGGPL